MFVPVMEEDGFQFRPEEVRKRIAPKTRTILINSPSKPPGAFYVLANARHISIDSLRLAFDIAEKVRLGVAPGIDFEVNAQGFFAFFLRQLPGKFGGRHGQNTRYLEMRGQ